MSKSNLVEITKGKTGTGLLIESDGYMSLQSKENAMLKEAIDNRAEGGLPNPFIVSAVFQKFGIENANGRIYPENILKREVEKYQQAIKERRAYGELNHPESSAIDGGRIAINIIELHWEGHTLVGKLEIPISDGFRKLGIVSTCADMVAQWLISGLKIGVSSRGLGSVQQMGVVTQPSTPGAWISENPENLQQYVESEDKKGTLMTESKYSKFNKWLKIGE